MRVASPRCAWPTLGLLLVGCGGKDLALGYDVDLPNAFADATPPVDLAAEVAASCKAREGPEVAYVDKSTFVSTLTGRWFLCEVDLDVGLPTVAALEFTSDGLFYPLTADSSGQFVRGAGESYWTGKDISTSTDAGIVWFDCNEQQAEASTCAPTVVVRFQSGPLRMLWSKEGDAPTVARYAKG